MDNLMTISNLRRDDYTGEILFRGRWYAEEEYLDLREDMERDEYYRDEAAEERAEARAELEKEGIMGSLVEILGNAVVERYCDECQHFKGIQKGQCTELDKLMKRVGAPTVPTVYGNSRADKCKLFRPLEFVDFVERAVAAGETLDGAA